MIAFDTSSKLLFSFEHFFSLVALIKQDHLLFGNIRLIQIELYDRTNKGGYKMAHKVFSFILNYINIVMLFTLADKTLSDRRNVNVFFFFFLFLFLFFSFFIDTCNTLVKWLFPYMLFASISSTMPVSTDWEHGIS